MRNSVARRSFFTLMPKLTARSSPRRSAVSFQAFFNDSGTIISSATARIASLSHEALARLPIVQKTSPCSVSSLATNCRMEISALKVKTSAIPNSTTPEVATRVQRLMPSRIKQASSAKTKAFAGMNHLSAMPGMPKPSTIASAAPKEAADDTPNVNGLASGLLRMVCISAPASPSAMPTATAISANGNRSSQTITRVPASAAAALIKVCQRVETEMPDGPSVKSSNREQIIKKNSAPARAKRRTRTLRYCDAIMDSPV